jgi:lipopolysaccharide/colanic/teichoic acid biosynthesis glycosyltransferase
MLRFKARAEMRRHGQRTDRLRRVVNIVVALVGLVLAAPVMLVVGCLVRLTSRGPIIYKQPRVGVDRRLDHGPGSKKHRREADVGGRVFTIYKFRTMRAEPSGTRQVWATSRDPRITPIGHVLRRTRLDELPQLFNVLKGDMNIVGPRPEQPEIFQGLKQELGHYHRRQRVLPGITGLAQVTLPYDQSVEDVKKKVDLDLEYIKRRSAANDLLIMAKTMPVMVFRRGAL